MRKQSSSDHGDDKNDGCTRHTAIYSWTRAIKLCDGNAEAHLMQGDATLQRLVQEIERRKRTKKSADRHDIHDKRRHWRLRGFLTHTRNLLRRAKFWLNGNCAPATLKDNLGPTTLKCSGTETWEHRTLRPSLARTRQG